MKTIMHVDMNSFFASCEIAMSGGRYRYDMPVIVGGDEEARHGIVLAATPPAKKNGLHAGMPLAEARVLCPDGIYLPARMDKYVGFSRRFMNILQYYSPLVESGGLDEAYIDYSGCEALFGSARTTADAIRERTKRELGLTVSVGISHNKLLAKQGSDFKKPDAVTELDDESFRRLLWPRDVSELMYVGPASTRRLHELSIFTIGQLACAPFSLLRAFFGPSAARSMLDHANGIDFSPVIPIPSPLKSISNSGTLPYNIKTFEAVSSALMTHSEKVAYRLRDIGCVAGTVHVYLRRSDLGYLSAQKKLAIPTSITNEIYRAAVRIAGEIWNGEPIRQVGIGLAQLSARTQEQISLFEPEKHAKLMLLDECIDGIRRKQGYASVIRASMLKTPASNQINAEDKFAFSTNAYKLLTEREF